jgi:hypothetical protein
VSMREAGGGKGNTKDDVVVVMVDEALSSVL